MKFDYIIYQVFDFVDDQWVPIGNRLCGRQIPPTFNSSGTKLQIRIRTDDDIQGDGFKVSSCIYFYFKITFSKCIIYCNLGHLEECLWWYFY